MFLVSVLLQSLVLGTQILLVAVGLYLVHTSSRIFHLAIGAIGAAAAYALFQGLTWGWPLAGAILLGMLVAFIFGLLSARLLEPFAARQEPLLGLLVSFALGLVIESAIAIFFGTDGKSLQRGVLATVGVRGAALDLPGVITVVLGLSLALFAWIIIHFTNAGRLLRSVAENPSLTTALGVNNKKVRYLTYSLSALVAAIIIGLTGWHTALTPLMGFQLVIAAFIALLMGGVNDLRGTVIASYLIAIIPSVFIGYIGGLSENWRLAIVFCVAAIILGIRPQGIFSKQLREA